MTIDDDDPGQLDLFSREEKKVQVTKAPEPAPVVVDLAGDDPNNPFDGHPVPEIQSRFWDPWSDMTQKPKDEAEFVDTEPTVATTED